MATKQLFGDRDHNQGVVKNYKFTVFADLAAATAVVGSIFGFAFLTNPGSLYYNQNGLAWQPIGAKGMKGDTGAAGNSVRSGVGPPSSGLGVDNDFYIDTAAATIYGPKTAGTWGAPTSLIGPKGDQGDAGVDGNTILSGVGAPGPSTGVDGNFYVDTAATAIYGPKAGGMWGSPTSLIGPKGDKGDTGDAGIPGPPGADGSVLIVDAGDAPSRTTESAADPSGTPAVGILFHHNTTTNVMWLWDGSSSSWQQLPGVLYYLDFTTDYLYEARVTMTSGMDKGWHLSAKFELPPVSAAIITVSGTLARIANKTIVPVDSTAGALTATLAPGQVGDRITFKDVTGAAEAKPITVQANGSEKLDSIISGTFVIDQAYGSVTLEYRTFDTNPSTTPVTGWWVVETFARPAYVGVSSALTLAVHRKQFVGLDSSGGSFSVGLPASPRTNDVVVLDGGADAELNPVTITGSIVSGSLVIDSNYMSVALMFDGTNWRIQSISRPVGAPVQSASAAGTISVARDQTILYDCSGGAFALALPGSPQEKDRIRLKEAAGSTNVLTLTGTVDGVVDPTFNTARQVIVIEYLSGAWRRMN